MSAMLPALVAGASIGLARVRGKRALLVLVATLGSALAVAAIERGVQRYGAGDRALTSTFRWIIPLSTAAWSALLLGGQNLRDAAWPASRFGLSRAGVAAGCALALALVAAASAWVASTGALLLARLGAPSAAGTLPIGSDLLTTAWISLLAGAAYAAWLSLGATFGRRGGGRLVILIADFVVGSAGPVGAIFPRGLAGHLIGGDAPLDLPQAASSALLPLVALLCLGLTALRSRD